MNEYITRQYLSPIENIAYELAGINLYDPAQVLSAVSLQGLILGMVKAKINHAQAAMADFAERTYSCEFSPPEDSM